jgi:SNF2 family DNA or RNA helicase
MLSQSPDAMGRLVVREGEIVLEVGGSYQTVSALDVFQVAIRGATSVREIPVSPDIDRTARGIRFHAEPSAVALLLAEGEGVEHASPAIWHGGAWEPIDLQADHLLLDSDWYPLDASSAADVRSWLLTYGTNLNASSYLELYRGLSRPFRIVDQLTRESVDHLAGGSDAQESIEVAMYPYQRDGLRWLSARANARLGGILADEMGLGKTLQIIALIAQRRADASPRGPSLVMLPATLMESWAREFRKFAPGISVYRHVGDARTRRPVELAKAEVVLTTYETAVIDQPILEQVAWDLVVVDEAQAIKNPETLRWKATQTFKREAAFAVTGTPLENRTLDTWSLSDFAVPGYLGSRSAFSTTLESEPTLLRNALRPLILRREVEQVALDLPKKIESDVALEMFSEEARLYGQIRDVVRRDRASIPMLALLTKLRMFTAHPDCVFGASSHPETRSAKLARLLEILDELGSSGVKSLIFVAFHQAADIVVKSIRRRSGVPVWAVDGRTPVADRQRIIDDFSALKGAGVIVLNPAAAGVGLNIQAASHVVHFTLEWNPARESQATARAWRRGQTRPVTVHRLFYASSIDEAIIDRLALKRDLFDAVIAATDEDDASSIKWLLDRATGVDSESKLPQIHSGMRIEDDN